jgi:hypothetical protein
MAAITPKFKFGFVLKSGNPNTRVYLEKSTTQVFNAGSLIKLASDGLISDMVTESDETATVKVSSGAWGIAQKDSTGVANSEIPVYVITPEQEWEVHTARTKKPNTNTLWDHGDAVKLQYDAAASYTLSDGASNTNKTAVGAWVAADSAASATKGAVIVGHRRGEEGTLGGRVIVRFTPLMCGGVY